MKVNSKASKGKGPKRTSKQDQQEIVELKHAEDMLHESQAALDAMINSTSDMIWSVDSKSFGVIWSNQSFQEYFLHQRHIQIEPGMRPEDLFTDPEYIQRWRGFFQRALAEGSYTTEYLVYGDMKILELSFNLLKRDGQVFGISVFGKDITAHKPAEATLQESEQRFRRLFESHSAVMLLIDPDSGAIMDANLAAVDFYGYAREQLIHMYTHDINMLSHQQAREAGQQIKEKQREKWIFPHRLANGEIRTVEVHSSPVNVNGQLLLFSIIQDVTEQKSAQEQLEFLKQSIDTALDPAYWMDRNGRFVYINEAACKSLGYTRGELLQMDVSDVAPRVTPEQWRKIWKQLKENKNRISESVHRRKDGSEFPVDVTSTYVQFEGQEFCNGFAQDITERKQTENAVRRLNRELQAISRCNAVLVRAEDEQTLLKDICRIVCNEAGYKMAWVGYAEHDEAKTVRPIAWAGTEAGYLAEASITWSDSPQGQGPNGIAIRTGERIYIQDFESDPMGTIWREGALQRGFRSSIALPLRGEDSKIFGALMIYSGEPNAFTPNELRLLEELASDLAFGINVLRTRSERRQVEQALHESEERYRRIIETAREGVFIFDADWRLSFANARFAEILGYEQTEILGRPIRDFVLEDDRSSHETRKARQTSGMGGAYENAYRTKSGAPVWLLISVTPMLEAGKFVGSFGMATDITERKRAEEAIALSEARYRSLVETQADIITRSDLSGNFSFVNDAFCRIFGIPYEQALGTDFRKTVFLEDLPIVLEATQTINQPHNRKYIEIRNITANGLRWFGWDNSSVLDDKGNIIEFQGVGRDITERKETEERLRQSEALYRQAIEVAGAVPYLQSYFDVGAAVQYDFIGDGIRQITGYGPEEFTDKLWDSLTLKRVLVEDLAEYSWNEAVRRVRSGLNPIWKCEHCIRTREGNIRWVFEAAVELRDQNGVSHGSIGLFQDITERKQAEEELLNINVQLEERVAERTAELHHTNVELERANQTKGEFLANMSHELRSPLNSILGLSESLLEQRRGLLNESQQRSLQIIESSGRHLLDLINDILDLSKIEAGKFDCYPEIIAIDAICNSSLSFVKSQAIKKSIQVTYSNETGISEISADPRRLKQILVNLLTNAVKFTPEKGHVILQIHADQEQNLLQLSVMDDGIGIAPENLARLFQPFVQVESQLNRSYEGTGLGLALVQKLTDLHGGSVQVESEVGKGSRFTINLPWIKEMFSKQSAQLSDEALATTLEKEPKLSEGHHKHGVILLAEDNAANVLTIGEYLESYGYDVIVAHDGLEALEKAEKAKPDIILMDIQMPVMDGLEATRRLRANPRFATTPIIALTALAMPGDRERCLEAGASEYMSKPVGLKILVKTIEGLLESHK